MRNAFEYENDLNLNGYGNEKGIYASQFRMNNTLGDIDIVTHKKVALIAVSLAIFIIGSMSGLDIYVSPSR